jgi:hypothetical protein
MPHKTHKLSFRKKRRTHKNKGGVNKRKRVKRGGENSPSKDSVFFPDQSVQLQSVQPQSVQLQSVQPQSVQLQSVQPQSVQSQPIPEFISTLPPKETYSLKICSTDNQCLIFPKPKSTIAKIFNNFNNYDNVVVSQMTITKIQRIYSPFIHYAIKMPYRYGFLTSLKVYSQNPNNSAAIYEGMIGKCLNVFANTYPCFITTYGVGYCKPELVTKLINNDTTTTYDLNKNLTLTEMYPITTVYDDFNGSDVTTVKKGWNFFNKKNKALESKKNVIEDDTKDLISKGCPKLEPELKPQPLYNCVLTEYITNFENVEILTTKNEFITTMFQLYCPLDALKNNFHHNNLNSETVVICYPSQQSKTNNEYITMRYHYTNEIITFKTKGIVKMVNYNKSDVRLNEYINTKTISDYFNGTQCTYNNDDTNSDLDFYNKIFIDSKIESDDFNVTKKNPKNKILIHSQPQRPKPTITDIHTLLKKLIKGTEFQTDNEYYGGIEIGTLDIWVNTFKPMETTKPIETTTKPIETTTKPMETTTQYSPSLAPFNPIQPQQQPQLNKFKFFDFFSSFFRKSLPPINNSSLTDNSLGPPEIRV